MRFLRISDAGDMKDSMLIYGGVEIRDLKKIFKIQMNLIDMLN